MMIKINCVSVAAIGNPQILHIWHVYTIWDYITYMRYYTQRPEVPPEKYNVRSR